MVSLVLFGDKPGTFRTFGLVDLMPETYEIVPVMDGQSWYRHATEGKSRASGGQLVAIVGIG